MGKEEKEETDKLSTGPKGQKADTPQSLTGFKLVVDLGDFFSSEEEVLLCLLRKEKGCQGEGS